MAAFLFQPTERPFWTFAGSTGAAMTTIAYSRAAGLVAADTQISSGPRKFRACKVRQLKGGGMIAGTGHWSNVLKIARWAEAGFPSDGPDDLDESDEAGFECLLVRANGSVFLLDSDLELMEFTDEFIAIGSGGPYAVAAMACGKSPSEAVEIAARFDPSTSSPVELFKVIPTKRKAKIRKSR